MGATVDEPAGTHLDLPLDDVEAGRHFFREILGVRVDDLDAESAEVQLGDGIVAHLHRRSPAGGAIPHPRTPGLIVQLQVLDVPTALAELQRRGATILVGPVLTDWSTESAFVAGPDQLVVELYRPLRP